MDCVYHGNVFFLLELWPLVLLYSSLDLQVLSHRTRSALFQALLASEFPLRNKLFSDGFSFICDFFSLAAYSTLSLFYLMF